MKKTTATILFTIGLFSVGCYMAQAQTLTNSEIALLMNSVSQANAQMIQDETAIALDQADLTTKQNDANLMNQEIQAGEDVYSQWLNAQENQVNGN